MVTASLVWILTLKFHMRHGLSLHVARDGCHLWKPEATQVRPRHGLCLSIWNAKFMGKGCKLWSLKSYCPKLYPAQIHRSTFIQYVLQSRTKQWVTNPTGTSFPPYIPRAKALTENVPSVFIHNSTPHFKARIWRSHSEDGYKLL